MDPRKNGRNYMGNWSPAQMGIWGTSLDKQELLRPMGIGTSRHWGQMGIWKKWAPGNMSTRVNRYLRQMGTLEHNGHLVTDGHWG